MQATLTMLYFVLYLICLRQGFRKLLRQSYTAFLSANISIRYANGSCDPDLRALAYCEAVARVGFWLRPFASRTLLSLIIAVFSSQASGEDCSKERQLDCGVHSICPWQFPLCRVTALQHSGGWQARGIMMPYVVIFVSIGLTGYTRRKSCLAGLEDAYGHSAVTVRTAGPELFHTWLQGVLSPTGC